MSQPEQTIAEPESLARMMERQIRADSLKRLEAKVRAELHPCEQMFPIYKIDIRWSEAYPPRAEQRMFRPGLPPLPEGRFWNSCGWERMAKEDADTAAIADELRREWWPKYIENKNLLEPADLTVTVELKYHDVWCEGWFSHYTIDVGLSDADVLASFERYAERIMYDYDMPEAMRDSMLMGAEDRWRWHGCASGDPQGEKTEAPCRCKHCKEQGLVKIDH